MNKLPLIAMVSLVISHGASALTINVHNNTDGQVQLSIEQLSDAAFKSISANNIFGDFILDKVREQTQTRVQEGLEASTTLTYGSQEKGTTTLAFCPRKIRFKKLSGSGAGKETILWTRENCNIINVQILNDPSGLYLIPQMVP